MAADEPTIFLNVDLDLQSQTLIAELLGALQPELIVLHASAHDWTLELSSQPSLPDDAIAQLGELIKSLPIQSRTQWDRCSKRCMNIGIQAGSFPREACFAISSKSIVVLGEIGAELAITVYAKSVFGREDDARMT